ncbi:MAG: glycosyl hydrolase [bacterium]|nr:glycosyl hydrolase [bacterium]
MKTNKKGRALIIMGLAIVLFLAASFTFTDGSFLHAQEKAKAKSKTVTFDSKAFGGFRARMIGPAIMSGRITALDAVLKDTRTMYVGTAGGGVWKTVDGGVTFRQVFRKHTMSIGAVTIDQKNPDTVWVGTGECNVRNTVSVGTGLYVTKDGGKNWKFKGLKDSERIAKVIVHPEESKTIYVAAMGHLWNGNEERGVFKSKDDGKTWKKILYMDQDTGCADLEMDPQEPDTLYASMWQFRRYPDFFESGGKSSGLHKSTDGGKSWKKLTGGLPKGNLGRIGLAIAPSRPGTLYALVEAKENGLYRSDSMGENWTKINDTLAVSLRPFYFSQLAVAPDDHNVLYIASIILFRSSNGGKSFDFGLGSVHPDLHAVWIDPNNPNHVVIGTDGGVYISGNKGRTFKQAANLPVSQFYHVSYDMKKPYNVYGGLQDNGSWYAPTRTYEGNGIQNKHWNTVGIGDGFYLQRHPADEDIIYYTWQGGRLVRVNERSKESKDIQPMPSDKSEPEYRYNWNAGFALSPTDPETMYIGAQFLFKSTNRGDSWEKISPDLTTNDPKKQRQEKSGGLTTDNTTAENHCSIFTVCESPKDQKLIWVGTDDGNIQVTRDGGKSWENVVKNIPGLPAGTWCSSIEASYFDAGTAFATFEGHMTGDMKPYVYKTTDFGKTWTSLVTDSIEGFCRIIRQDLVSKDLLFLGSEFGLFVSIDGGKEWAHLTNAIPKVAVFDLKIHPREHDLIIATHGLGIQIIDDITPFRGLTAEVLNADAAVLTSRTAIMETPINTQEFPGDSGYFGPNPRGGAAVTYYLKKRHIFGTMKLEVLDADGKVIKTLNTTKNRGLNRVFWNMRLKPPKAAKAPGLSFNIFTGPMVAEGEYTVRLVKGKKNVTGKIKLIPNPVSAHSKADRELRHETVMKLYDMQGELGFVGDNVQGLIDRIKKMLETAKGKKTKSTLEKYKTRLEDFHHSIIQHQGAMAGDKLREKVVTLYSSVIQFGGKPTDSQRYYLSVLKERIKEAETKYNTLVKRVKSINASLKGKKLGQLKLMTREEYKKKK